MTDLSSAAGSTAALSGAQADVAPEDEFRLRRSFAIISHPDAGKTTLTEKLLLAGGAIRMAGAVRARGERRRTRSDWMAIERERGISVSSTVMRFERNGLVFNLLDTPGHEDFSEDTYRTLTAVDSAVMVIDAAKGIEAQTRKLFEVCRLRDIPIITFINKIDREARHPFELLDEIESTLALDAAPVVWPVGMGTDFYGCFDVLTNNFLTSSQGRSHAFDTVRPMDGPDDPRLDEAVHGDIISEFRDSLSLAREGYSEFDAEAFREGHLTPVIFGSALRDYSVDQLLDLIAGFAPPPRTQPTDGDPVEPTDENVTGFVFKVQANMDPNHRDRIAFLRLCSGRFRRGMKLNHVRTGKALTVHSPVLFFAQERQIADDAVAGDVIGIPNHGTLRVGDTLSEQKVLNFTGLPSFAPEVLRRVMPGDSGRVKQVRTALQDLAEEGLVQVFKPLIGSQWIVGVVGILQLDVLSSRVAGEYGAEITVEPVQFQTARWITAPAGSDAIEKLKAEALTSLAEDRDGRMVFLARNSWELDNIKQRFPDLVLRDTCELTH
ncbi:peptide chain release factor 3 [Faunimonas pinastri]|uniref:Peptide chain release factor 3 n=1 Tax=Faunimonas pinastri TaxID=1855383 RepID=A0A1H9LXB4_9HYPH|nr:peptide chain release factor 3 [Faunimonas pinastri]SER15483.1 peptide chain release factor 3 [Faunimonas pinastri]